MPELPELSERDRAILQFEARSWPHQGRKEAAILETFGLTSARYHQLLLKVIAKPEALAAEPVLVKRLQRLVARRAQARAAREFRAS